MVKIVEHTRTTIIVQHPRGGRHKKPAAYNRSRYNTLEDTDALVILIYYCGKGMFANCNVYMKADHCSKTRGSFLSTMIEY